MLIIKVPIHKLSYERKEYPQSLKESLMKIKVSKPIRVVSQGDQYQVIDGHKRCSAIEDLQDENFLVMIVIVDDFSKSGSGNCGNRNHH